MFWANSFNASGTLGLTESRNVQSAWDTSTMEQRHKGTSYPRHWNDRFCTHGRKPRLLMRTARKSFFLMPCPSTGG
jgi:hypothetical protein